MDLDKSHNDVLNAQLNLTLEESTILELEARKTSLTDSTQSQIDSLSEEQLYVKTASAKSIATCPAGEVPPWRCWPLPMVTWWRLTSHRAITQNSEVVVVIRKNTAATMEGTCMFRQRGGARGERR